MILKIVVLILLIEIIAGIPQVKPKGFTGPWPPKKETGPGPRPNAPKRDPKQHSPCVCTNGPKTTPGGCVFKKPPPKPKPPPKKGGKRGIWDPPVPAVKCQPGRTPPVFLGLPDPDSPVYPEYPENPENPEYPGFPEYPGRPPYKRIRWLLCSMAIQVVEFSNGGYKIRNIFA